MHKTFESQDVFWRPHTAGGVRAEGMAHRGINTRTLRDRCNEAQPRTTGFRVLKSAALRPQGRCAPRADALGLGCSSSGDHVLGDGSERIQQLRLQPRLHDEQVYVDLRTGEKLKTGLMCWWQNTRDEPRTGNFLSNNREHSCFTWRFSELWTNDTNFVD